MVGYAKRSGVRATTARRGCDEREPDRVMPLNSLRQTGRPLRWIVAAGLGVVAILYVTVGFPEGDAARLQGRWRVVVVEDSGVLVNQPFLTTRQYLFHGHKMIVRGRGGPVASTWVGRWVERNLKSPTFRVDPSASPKAIDLDLPFTPTMRGIYDLDGDRLRICFSGPSGQARTTRPTGFSVPGSGARLLILKRDHE